MHFCLSPCFGYGNIHAHRLSAWQSRSVSGTFAIRTKAIFQEIKAIIVDQVGLDKDALHIYVALIVFLLTCKLFRWPASSWKPWCVVLVLAMTGEYLDWRHSLARELPVIIDYHWTDLWNTMLVPTILVIAARFTRIFERPLPKGESD